MLHPNAIDHVDVLGVVRLAVHAILGAGGPLVVDIDDNDIAAGQTLLAVINENYVWENGATWRRWQGSPASGGADERLVWPYVQAALEVQNMNAGVGARMTCLRGGMEQDPLGSPTISLVVGGLVTSPADTFLDGDSSCLHFDLAGRLLTTATAGVTDTDDDAVAAGQTVDLAIDLNYGFDGTDWGRLRIKSAAAATSDERLAHLSTMAVLALIDTGAPAGSMEIPIAANRNVGAVATETGYYLPTRASVMGYDASQVAGSRSVPVVASNFDAIADVDADLIGLLTNSRLAFYNGDINKWERLEGRASLVAQAYTLGRILTDSVVRGDDGATYSAIAARAAGAAHSEALIHLLTSSCVYGYDASLGVGVRDVPIGSDLASAISGRLATAFRGLNADSLTCGIDNTVAAPNNVLRPVEARAGSAAPADTLIRLLTQSSLYAYDSIASVQKRLTSIDETSVAVSESEMVAGLNVYQARESEFAAARRGKRFYGTHQTPGTLITAQTAFVATTPTLMYRINSAAIRAIIRSLDISIGNTPGGVVYITVCLDTSDRWSAGGTAIAAVNSNEESVTAGVGLLYSNPTATAAGAGTRYIGTWIVPAAAAANCSLDFADGLLLGPTASTLLVYIWSAVTAAQVVAVLDYEEVS